MSNASKLGAQLSIKKQIDHNFSGADSKLYVKWQLNRANPNDYRTPWWAFAFTILRTFQRGGLRMVSWEFIRHDCGLAFMDDSTVAHWDGEQPTDREGKQLWYYIVFSLNELLHCPMDKAKANRWGKNLHLVMDVKYFSYIKCIFTLNEYSYQKS